MTFFDVLSLVGGIALFLYGMDVLGKSLEKAAGSQLKSILSKLTNSTIKGLLLGVAVTAVIQSSAATTVMVVGFVNSGLMQLGQAVGVIMGANIGTTVTAWILSLNGISGSSFFCSASESDELHTDSCHHRRCTSNVFKARTQTQHRFGHDRLCRADVRHEYNERKR